MLTIESVAAKKMGELALPMKAEDFRITSTYGERQHPVTGQKVQHNGYDLRAKEGTEYYAVAKSKVVSSHASKTGGWIVRTEILDGPLKGYTVEYMNSYEKDVVVKEGDILETGDLIALTGANGQATGPHLHISLVREYDSNGKAVYEDLADYNKELRELVEDSAKESNV